MDLMPSNSVELRARRGAREVSSAGVAAATPSSGATEQRSIAKQIGRVRLRGRSVVFMRDTPMHTRELPLTLAPWALFRVLARKEQPFFIDAGRPWGGEWFSSMGFNPRMQFRVDGADSALSTLAAAATAMAPSHAPIARERPVP